ncbi:MAG: hypothetical protein ACI8RD_008335 [Bacillariaceae sp.]|jgi:hypothetical protein
MGSSSGSRGWNISYRIFGPTTVHLRHELYLLISLSMLGYASIRDIRYTILISIWLSRNLWIRYLLISCDRYTCVSERTIPGILSPGKFQFNVTENIIDFICSFVLAGQIFDRPKRHIVANFIGTNHTAADDMMVENDLSNLTSHPPSGLSSSMGSSSSKHNRRSGKSNNKQNNNNNNNNNNNKQDNTIRGLFDRLMESFYIKCSEIQNAFPSSLAVATSEDYWNRIINTYTPSLQMVLPIATLLFLYFCYEYPLSYNNNNQTPSTYYNNDNSYDSNSIRNLSGTVNGFTRYFSWIYGDITYLLRDVEYFFYGTAPASHYNPTKEHNLNGNSNGNVVNSPFVTNHALQMEAMKYSTAVGYSGGYLHDSTKPYGLYERSYPPSWIECFYYIMIPATVLGIFCFGRVILLPIPDLVSGSSNIVKSLRTASKKQASSVLSVAEGIVGSGSHGGGGGGHHSGGSKSSHRNSSSKGGVVVEESGEKHRDQPWLEQYQSIITDHRFKLICKVAFIRLLENVFICAVLPRTEFACKTTGQCANKSGLLELPKVMFFAGITSPLRSDYQYGSGGTGEKPFSVGDNLLRPDTVSAYMIGISVVVITLSLLLAQAATLNRSHLGITGYLAGGWIAVDDDDDYNNNNSNESSSSSDNNNSNSNKNNKASSTLQQLQQQQKEQQTSEWEPRKRYKKGDVIKYRRTIYRATTNNPEGVPFDLFLRATYKLFRNELGHPATSKIVAFVSTVQFGLISCLILLILIYQLLLEFDDTLTSLLWTLAANLIAVYGTVSVAVPNYNEFDQIAKSIFD